jgi:hypothetical protein
MPSLFLRAANKINSMQYNKEEIGVRPSTDLDGVVRDEGGRILPGSRLNPSGRGGFQERPETRNKGGWKRSETARYKLEQMVQLTESELMDIITSPASPVFEQKLAKAIIDGTWTVIKEMMQEVYGRKTDVDMNMKMDDSMPIIRGFVIPTAPEDFIDDNGYQNPKYGRSISES